MKKRKIVTLALLLTLASFASLLLAGCSPAGLNLDPTGTYTFNEIYYPSKGSAPQMRDWTITFENGNYELNVVSVSEVQGWFGGPTTTTVAGNFSGTYTVEGENVHCEAPIKGTQKTTVVNDEGTTENADEVDPIDVLTYNFFNEDISCDWKLDKENGTALPVRYREPASNVY